VTLRWTPHGGQRGLASHDERGYRGVYRVRYTYVAYPVDYDGRYSWNGTQLRIESTQLCTETRERERGREGERLHERASHTSLRGR